jgi:hypothetical protein
LDVTFNTNLWLFNWAIHNFWRSSKQIANFFILFLLT